MYIVHITDVAKAEFRRVVSYIVKELKAPQAADHLAKETEYRIKLLEDQPFKFPLVQDSARAALNGNGQNRYSPPDQPVFG